MASSSPSTRSTANRLHEKLLAWSADLLPRHPSLLRLLRPEQGEHRVIGADHMTLPHTPAHQVIERFDNVSYIPAPEVLRRAGDLKVGPLEDVLKAIQREIVVLVEMDGGTDTFG